MLRESWEQIGWETDPTGEDILDLVTAHSWLNVFYTNY